MEKRGTHTHTQAGEEGLGLPSASRGRAKKGKKMVAQRVTNSMERGNQKRNDFFPRWAGGKLLMKIFGGVLFHLEA